jgi:hypothetical protein
VTFHPHSRRLRAIATTCAASLEARIFLDASIEGDLLASAGVETVIGREPNSRYGETLNGIRGENTYRQFAVRVDPYRIPGDPSSGLIPTIQDEPLGTPGDGDRRIQAFCFRLCLTRDPANRLPITRPAGYDPATYEIYRRYAKAGGNLFTPRANLPNGKTDLGSWHDLSANLYGMNHAWPAGDSATRRRIYAEHRSFTHGLLWTLANDPDLPEALRAAWRDWGLARDEFTGNQGWPRQIYVRDARRMVSDFVLTEHHTRKADPAPVDDPVSVAYWPPDTHAVRRIVRDGAAYNEGFVFGGRNWAPFGVSWRAMLPRRKEAANLLTATCLSSSHVAYGAIRIEWTFMSLGQAAAAASVLALEQGRELHDIDYTALRARLLARGLVLSVPENDANLLLRAPTLTPSGLDSDPDSHLILAFRAPDPLPHILWLIAHRPDSSAFDSPLLESASETASAWLSAAAAHPSEPVVLRHAFRALHRLQHPEAAAFAARAAVLAPELLEAPDVLALLDTPAPPVPGAMGLSWTEARAHLLHAPPTVAANGPGGLVRVLLTIGVDGRVTSVRPLSGPTALWGRAADAARLYRFQPFLFEGRLAPASTAALVVVPAAR